MLECQKIAIMLKVISNLLDTPTITIENTDIKIFSSLPTASIDLPVLNKPDLSVSLRCQQKSNLYSVQLHPFLIKNSLNCQTHPTSKVPSFL